MNAITKFRSKGQSKCSNQSKIFSITHPVQFGNSGFQTRSKGEDLKTQKLEKQILIVLLLKYVSTILGIQTCKKRNIMSGSKESNSRFIPLAFLSAAASSLAFQIFLSWTWEEIRWWTDWKSHLSWWRLSTWAASFSLGVKKLYVLLTVYLNLPWFTSI